jgi:membrane protein implicated in regulation of membrane protease activity
MANLSLIEIIYWISAVTGGTLFVLRTLLMLIGGFGDADVDGDMGDLDMDVSHNFDVDHGDIDHADADFSFKFLSLQGLTAFFMMFGLVGLALFHADMMVLLTIVGGTVAGLFTVWVISVIFTNMKRLQSSGTLDIKNAVGQSGKVYLGIPANGSGQVQVSVQGALRVLDAVSYDKKKITTGTSVKVVDVLGEKTLVVEKID